MGSTVVVGWCCEMQLFAKCEFFFASTIAGSYGLILVLARLLQAPFFFRNCSCLHPVTFRQYNSLHIIQMNIENKGFFLMLKLAFK